jgi:hypothetical protein
VRDWSSDVCSSDLDTDTRHQVLDTELIDESIIGNAVKGGRDMLSITERRREAITDVNPEPLPPRVVFPLNPQPLPPGMLPPDLFLI